MKQHSDEQKLVEAHNVAREHGLYITSKDDGRHGTKYCIFRKGPMHPHLVGCTHDISELRRRVFHAAGVAIK